MAKSSSQAGEISDKMKNLESSPPEETEEYHETKFWKKLHVGAVTAADPKTVLAATKDLCRHFVSQENRPLFMQKAARLAAQFRSQSEGVLVTSTAELGVELHSEDADRGTFVMHIAPLGNAHLPVAGRQLHDCLAKLLVDHKGLQKMFTLDPNVPFDLQVSSWVPKLSTREARSQTKPKPLTVSLGDEPKSPLRLSFADHFLYKKRDQSWLEDFISSVDRLTEVQALVFGPAFATLFVVLGISSSPLLIADQMCRLCETLRWVPLELARQIGTVNVKMPPHNKLTTLLSVYAEEDLPPVYFNTVVGGLMYAFYKQKLPLHIKNNNLLFCTLFVGLLSHSLRQMPLTSFLEDIKYEAKSRQCPRLTQLYSDFVEQKFPESWKAYRRVTERYNNFETDNKDDPFCQFAAAFSDKAFEELSYERNHRLCNITAVVTDLLRSAQDVEEWPKLGATYRQWVQDKPFSCRISHSDYLLAVDIYKVLQNELDRAEENPE